MEDFPLAWWVSTPFGAPWQAAQPDSVTYEMAFRAAENALANVKCFCPDLYPTALSIQLALYLRAWTGAGGVVDVAGANPAGKHALVKKDEVYDTKREYHLVAAEELAVAASPANMLKDILARCVAPFSAGASLISSFPGGRNGGDCSCAPFNPMASLGDKVDTP